MTRVLTRVKAATAYVPPAHVTLGSFSTDGFARAAITIITGLRGQLCERVTGARFSFDSACFVKLI